MNFEIVAGDVSSPYVIHVPHSSVTIPDDVRAQFQLDDDALAEELRLLIRARRVGVATRLQGGRVAATARRRPSSAVRHIASRVVMACAPHAAK